MILDQSVKRAEEVLKKAQDMPETKRGDRAGAIVAAKKAALKDAKEQLKVAKEALDKFVEERKEKDKILNINKLIITTERKRVEDTAELLRLKYKNQRLAKEEVKTTQEYLDKLQESYRTSGLIADKKGHELHIAKQLNQTRTLQLNLEAKGWKMGEARYTQAMLIHSMEQDIATKTFFRVEAEKALAEEQKKQLARFKDLQREAKRLNAIQTDSEKLGKSIANSFETAMMSMVDGTMSVKDAFKSMTVAIIKDLYKIYVVKKITGMITSAFAGGDAALSGPQHMGGKANGGSVQGGKSYTVGERGPEVFTPAMSGTITPNSGGGGGATTIVQNINVSTGVQQTVRAEIRQMMPQIADSAKGAVLDAKRRGGSYGRAMA